MQRRYGPIQTEYKGYRFRSRLEARWAVFLDSCGAPWEYEKEGYSLPSGPYLPDFWLPHIGCWLEIKGLPPTSHEARLCEELAEVTTKPVAIAWGLPGTHLDLYCTDGCDSGCGTAWQDESFWAVSLDNKLCICINDTRKDRVFLNQDYSVFPGAKKPYEILCPLPIAYMNTAKQARFEHRN